MKAHASPTKEFFINMITRDIGLEECIFDLLDNSLDGAARQTSDRKTDPSRYSGYRCQIEVSESRFSIKDNCGGIPITAAQEYAFHFGRRQDAPEESDRPIGLYGIGMKRAIFKLGRSIRINSSTQTDAFSLDIDVPTWAAQEEWDFDMTQESPEEEAGTEIEVTELREGTAGEFSDSAFATRLIKNIATYYSFFLLQGFSVTVNDKPVSPHGFRLKRGDEMHPVHFTYEDESGVIVTISAGLAAEPPDDISPEVKLQRTEYWGWFVLCNDRVVVAGDKSDKTVWGDGTFNTWHPQYNGFMGIVKFTSDHADKLPWTTTKRDIETSDPVYRRSVIKMKDATRPYLDYTNQRKDDVSAAKEAEKKAVLQDINTLPESVTMRLPTVTKTPKVANILYQRPKELVQKVAEALGNRNLTYRTVGERTFDYYVENELDD